MVTKMKFSLVILLLLDAQRTFALDQKKCSKLLNKGWYKKYEYGGIDQPLTKATKREGSSKGVSETSTEGSTALSDPKYWSNVSTSETQSTSSFGECNLFGLQKIKENRDSYIAQNSHRTLNEIAIGKGDHLDTIATFSLCEDQYFSAFAESLHTNMKSFLESKDQNYGSVVDRIVASDPKLAKGCHSFNTL